MLMEGPSQSATSAILEEKKQHGVEGRARHTAEAFVAMKRRDRSQPSDRVQSGEGPCGSCKIQSRETQVLFTACQRAPERRTGFAQRDGRVHTPVMKSKRLLVFKEMLVEAGIKDETLFDEMRQCEKSSTGRILPP